MHPFADSSQPARSYAAKVITIQQLRRLRLALLIVRHAGRTANLNERLGYKRADGRLNRMKNEGDERGGGKKVYRIGDDAARDIERKLGLPPAWMDAALTAMEVEELAAGFERYPRVRASMTIPAFGFAAVRPVVQTALHNFYKMDPIAPPAEVREPQPGETDAWTIMIIRLMARLPEAEKKGALANLRAYVQQLGYTL